MSSIPKLTISSPPGMYVESVTGENLVMNDFSVSRPGGFRAGPKLSCSTILKSLKLDTASQEAGEVGRAGGSHFLITSYTING